jgi:transposase
MLYAAIDIHKRTFHAAVLDVDSGETSERRFGATREELKDWAMPLQGTLAAVAIEATNGWRWAWRELSALGFDVRLVDPAQAKALRGPIKRAKTDRRALAVRVVGEGDAARVVAAADRDPNAARPDTAAQSARGGPHALGPATARAFDA